MRHQRLDLNLLVALCALLTELRCHALRIACTQPNRPRAESCRGCEHFEEPLIVQVGRRIALTLLGVSLLEPVSDLLVRFDATLGTRLEVDLASTRRFFFVMASDYVLTVLLADLLRRVHLEALCQHR
jgi:LysR family transcriptional regulator, nod-box dependent transcriptional activator